MEQLAVAIRCYTKDTYIEIIDNIKKSGFKNVFIEWYDDDIDLQNNILSYVRKLNLNVIFAHLGYKNVNALWLDNEIGENEYRRYINDIKTCKENGIDLVILHPTYTFDIPAITEIGIERIKKILSFANEIGVKVAFENVEIVECLEYIIKNIQTNNLGICFDVGHCHLFSDDMINTKLFKDKVYMIHLHDNFKENDDHNLPFDGTVDWNLAIKQITEMNYNGFIVIESGLNKYYSNLTFEEYYSLAYERGKKLIEMFELYKNG